MQFSVAQQAADGFVSLINDPVSALDYLLGENVWETEWKDQGGAAYVSDWLQIWLLSGLAHEACSGDVNVYIHAVALVFVEFSTNENLFAGLTPVPPQPRWLVTPATEENSRFVVSQEFLLPESLTPAGFTTTRRSSQEARRAAVMDFFVHPERSRYGYNTYLYHAEK